MAKNKRMASMYFHSSGDSRKKKSVLGKSDRIFCMLVSYIDYANGLRCCLMASRISSILSS